MWLFVTALLVVLLALLIADTSSSLRGAWYDFAQKQHLVYADPVGGPEVRGWIDDRPVQLVRDRVPGNTGKQGTRMTVALRGEFPPCLEAVSTAPANQVLSSEVIAGNSTREAFDECFHVRSCNDPNTYLTDARRSRLLQLVMAEDRCLVSVSNAELSI